MKILNITPTLSIPDLPPFNENTSGLGYMVKDIMDSTLETSTNITQLDVFVFRSQHSVSILNKERVLPINWRLIMRHLKLVRWRVGFGLLLKYGYSLKTFSHIIYFTLLSGYLIFLLKKEKYDIVHIHGVDLFDDFLVEYCKHKEIPFLLTLHGLNVFGTKMVSTLLKRHELSFIKRMALEDNYVSFVSTGSMRKILSYFKLTPTHFSVIQNAFHLVHGEFSQQNIRFKYNLPQDSIIILYVGNISLRKNQAGFVDAFSLLPKNIAKNVYVLFIGRDDVANSINDAIRSSDYQTHFVNCGFVDKKEIIQYYSQANGVALVSRSEGFGLALVEGFSYGLPGLAVSNMDAIEDLKSDDALVIAKDLTKESIAEGIKQLITRVWDKAKILEHSKKFSMETMGKKYVSLYNTILNATR